MSSAIPNLRDRYYDLTDGDDIRYIGLELTGTPNLNVARWRFGLDDSFLPNGLGMDLVLTDENPGGDGTLWTDGSDLYLGDSTIVGSVGVTGSGTTNQIAYWTSSGAIGGDTGLTYDAATDILTVVGGVRSGAGTAAAPTFSFSTDTNTGIYSVAGDQLGVSTGGTLRVTVSTTGVLSTLPWWGADGTAGTPGISFSSDQDTGIYSVGANSLGVSTGGTLRLTVVSTGITATVPLLASAGSAGAPSLGFAGDTNTGLYSIGADNLGVSIGGVLRVDLSTTAITSTIPYLASAGLVTAPSLSFAGDLDTGFYWIGANQVGLATGGTLRVSVSSSGMNSTIPYLAPNGLVTAAAFAFAGDLNTGLYWIGADQLGVTVGSQLTLGVSMTAITAVVPVLLADGAVGAPALSFATDTNTGLYSIGADQLGVATNGVLRLTVSTTAITATIPLVAAVGAVGAPSLTFAGDLNTGLYWVGADQLGVSTGGTLRLDVSTTAITATLPLVAAVGAVGAPSLTFAGDLNTGLYWIGADQIGVSTNGALRLTISTTALTSTLIGIFPATTTGGASIRLPHGTVPDAPVDGDLWTTSAGLYVRINGVTVGPLAA